MQNLLVLRPDVRAAFERLRDEVVEPELEGAPAHRRIAFLTRFERFYTELHDPLETLYAADPRLDAERAALLRATARAAMARDETLWRLDHEREITPDWLQREHAVGYVAYVDRFAGTLDGVRERLPYLRELGITYLHLMPLLRTRPEPSDGGYAVADYHAVQPALGTMADLRALAGELRDAGIALCIDVVLNHTAREHAWARGAVAGDEELLSRYLTFPDRELPDAYERTLTDVFPATAPGAFSFDEDLGRWVWTTFNPYQWDLDYANPAVFRTMAETILFLAGQGVDVLRLDAVPFLWKRLGTTGQNQPEVHDILQALRALMRIAAPGVAFKAEAIVAPGELVAYLGTGRHEGKECDLAYHNVLMVLLWSALASGKVALMTHTLQAMPPTPPASGWVTYVRVHDDIGWAITEEDAAAVGESGYLHRRFLVDFYAGDFPGSFARGARYQEDERTGDARTSGMTASLAGLDAAGGDPDAQEVAIRRILLLYGVAFAHGGLPLIYMGDELGLRNDPHWDADPQQAGDNRWMHRPHMDWEAAARRRDPNSVEGRLWAGLRRLVEARRATRALHMAGRSEPLWTGNEHVFGLERRHAGERLLVLANFTGASQGVHAGVARARGYGLEAGTPSGPDGRPLELHGDVLALAPYQFAWLRGE